MTAYPWRFLTARSKRMGRKPSSRSLSIQTRPLCSQRPQVVVAIASIAGIAPSNLSCRPAICNALQRAGKCGCRAFAKREHYIPGRLSVYAGHSSPAHTQHQSTSACYADYGQCSGAWLLKSDCATAWSSCLWTRRVDPRFDSLYQLEDSASSTYNGLTLALNKRMIVSLSCLLPTHCQRQETTHPTLTSNRRILRLAIGTRAFTAGCQAALCA